MTQATPVRSNGIWGNVVAVVHNGETITPETVGEVIYENREVTHTRPGCYPVTQTLPVAFQSIKPWDVLADAGLLPDLTPIPEPIESRRERAKSAVDSWWQNKAMAGIDVGNGIVLRGSDDDAIKLRVYINDLTPSDTMAMFTDVSGNPHFVSIGDVPALADAYRTEFNARRQTWGMAKVAIDSAADQAEIDQILTNLN